MYLHFHKFLSPGPIACQNDRFEQSATTCKIKHFLVTILRIWIYVCNLSNDTLNGNDILFNADSTNTKKNTKIMVQGGGRNSSRNTCGPQTADNLIEIPSCL